MRSGSLASSPSIDWPVHSFTDISIGADQALCPGQSMHRTHNVIVTSSSHASDLERNEHLAIHLEYPFSVALDLSSQLQSPFEDSGGSANLASLGLLNSWLSTRAIFLTLRLADDSSALNLDKLTLHFKLQSCTIRLFCHVTDFCDESDLILGNSFMLGHQAVLDCSNCIASCCGHDDLYK